MSQNFDRRSAWKAKQQEIEDFILKSQDNTRSRVAYLQSAHASGKSTTMLEYIMRLISKTRQKTHGSPWFIYVVPHSTESNVVMEYLEFAAKDEELGAILTNTSAVPDDRYMITTYDRFLEYHSKDESRWPKKMVMMVDVEIRATVAGEIFFGKLLEIVEDKNLAINVLLVSPHRSRRTIEIFKDFDFEEIVVPDINPQLNYKLLPPQDNSTNPGQLVKQVLQSDNESKAVILASDVAFLGHLNGNELARCLFVTGRDVRAGMMFSKVEERVLVVDPEAGVSAYAEGVRLVISQGVSTSVMFDTMTSQLVTCERSLTKNEIAQEQSWALKTTSNVEHVAIYLALNEVQQRHVKSSHDPWSPAWNADLPRLILTLFQAWPDTCPKYLPIRPIPDLLAFYEMLGRLRVMGLLENDDETGRYSLSKMGQYAFVWMKGDSRMQIHAAYLMAVVMDQKDNVSLNVIRVLIRMAVISVMGIHTFCTLGLVRGQDRPSLGSISRECEGVGATECWRGALWVALGVYLKCHRNEEFLPNSGTSVTRGCLGVNPSQGYAIANMAMHMEQLLGIEMSDDEVEDTKLDKDEIVVVEKHLMWAWVHRVVGINCNQNKTDRIFDVVSDHPVAFDVNGDLFDINRVTSSNQFAQSGGIFAIYDRLVRGEGEKLPRAENLTFIRARNFHDVEVKEKSRWPIPVASRYPLHIQK